MALTANTLVDPFELRPPWPPWLPWLPWPIFFGLTLGTSGTRSLSDPSYVNSGFAFPLWSFSCRDCPKGIDFSSAVHCDICEQKKKHSSCNSLLCICFKSFSMFQHTSYLLHLVAKMSLCFYCFSQVACCTDLFECLST